MNLEIFYKQSVIKDFSHIEKKYQKKIKGQIENELSKNPGKDKKLKGEFERLYSYRVGDYRVIYTLIPEGILILRIRHRKEVYR